MRHLSTMTDQAINEIEASYDRVAAEYTLRISGELSHKPLDRELESIAQSGSGKRHVILKSSLKPRDYRPRTWLRSQALA